jgi:soluble P-type ATPase
MEASHPRDGRVAGAMSLIADIPGRAALHLEHLVLDINGTLTDRGQLIEGVETRVAQLSDALHVHLLSADTWGTARETAARLDAALSIAADGEHKRDLVDALGADRCVAIGNGANDVAVLEAVALGVAVVGPEGASGAALRAAEIVTTSITDALDLLLDPRALTATLRA